MYSKEDLRKMSNEADNNTDIDNLIDINSVNIKAKDSIEKRLFKFIKNIKNPYCFRCDNVIVRLNFTSNDKDIEDCLIDLFVQKSQL